MTLLSIMETGVILIVGVGVVDFPLRTPTGILSLRRLTAVATSRLVRLGNPRF